jgi:hypothetical protein
MEKYAIPTDILFTFVNHQNGAALPTKYLRNTAAL